MNNIDLLTVAMSFKRDVAEFERAARQFTNTVDPRIAYQPYASQHDQDMMNLFFTEWFLFEYILASGQTPLRSYVANPPHGAEEESVKALSELVDSQTFSQFTVHELKPHENTAVFQDMRDGQCYLVHDAYVSRKPSYEKGSVATRIGKINDEWQCLGGVLVHDNTAAEDTFILDFLPFDGVHASQFLALAKNVIGTKGSTRVSAYSHTDEDPAVPSTYYSQHPVTYAEEAAYVY